VTTVLGATIVEDLAVDSALLWLVVPWVKDLARGLHLRSARGSIDVRTTSLLRLLGGDRVSEDDLQRAASSIDVAAALQLGDELEQVLGPGAATRSPSANEAELAWIETLKLGHHLHLVLEFLRLLPPRVRRSHLPGNHCSRRDLPPAVYGDLTADRGTI